MRIAIIGQGYVGLTAAVSLAASGHDVIGVEAAHERLTGLLIGQVPIYEPGIQELMAVGMSCNRLTFIGSLSLLQGTIDAIIVAVGTPPLSSGQPDLRQVRTAIESILESSSREALIIVKSTIPPGTSEQWLRHYGERLDARYVYNPEFLNQGTALNDWQSPARIVIGLNNREHLSTLQELYKGVIGPWVITDPTSAETIKYASNAFLATKISFANEIGGLCEAVGADVDHVIHGTGLDPRIGSDFLRVGVGFGDSCLPKDTRALSYWSQLTGRPLPLLQAVIAVNNAQRLKVVRMVQEQLGHKVAMHPTVAVLGVAYEPSSDDIRDAPSRVVIPELEALGVGVRVWDPGLSEAMVKMLLPAAVYCATISEAVNGAAVAVVLTQWPQTRDVQWEEVARAMVEPRAIIDAQNWLEAATVVCHGLGYQGIGRRHQGPTSELSVGRTSQLTMVESQAAPLAG